MIKKFKQDRGVAGLSILLGLVVMLFIIGLIVMIFTLMGNEMRDATYTSTTATATNETVTTLNDTVGDYLTYYSLRNAVCTVTSVMNVTSGVAVPTSNYTATNCLLKGNAGDYLGQNVNVTYTYTYDADNDATDVMNDTVTGLASTVDWFDIFIVIGAMVVLILLTVIIVTAIKGSGMVNNDTGSNNVGTA